MQDDRKEKKPVESFNFTKKIIEGLDIPPEKWTDYRDSENHFLRIRVYATGRKTFYYVRKIAGKVSWIKLDTFPEMSVYQARTRCAELSGEYARGNDPTRERKQTKETRLKDLFELFMSLHSRPHKKRTRDDECIFRVHLKGLADKAAYEITTEVITRLHNRIGTESGKTIANRTLALVKSMFNFGLKNGYFEGNNPGMGVRMFKEQSRERFLNADELKRFFIALEDPKTAPDMRDFFTLSLFTGARRGNVQSMKWGDLDLESGVWTIQGGESKSGDLMRVILSEEAIEILTRRRSWIGENSIFVFPSRGKTGHLMEPKKAWTDLLTRAGIENLRIHDLRRTLGSWQAATGASLPVIGKSLGHKNQSTTAIYARLNLDPVRLSVNKAIKSMRKAGNGKNGDEQA